MFGRIVVVDWSANSTPKRGADSIWSCSLDTTTGATSVVNHPTRAAARASLLDELQSATSPVLVGCDFPFGYPAGFAAAAGLAGTPWSAIWSHVATTLDDDERNRNNRWQVAADLNERLGELHFWGVPPRRASEHLTTRRPPPGRLPAYRASEATLRAQGLRPFSVWQLLGAGSVGSQALTGIAVLEHVRRRFGARVRAWPFETGLAHPRLATDTVVLAEVWPSAIGFGHVDHPVKDARQVIALAHHLAARQADGTLAADMAPRLDPATAAAVQSEEGWVLGVAAQPPTN